MVYFISDLHLDHKNIIRYCHRPFKDVEEMNAAIVSNWNNLVGSNDLVYLLGDIAFGRGSHSPRYWLNRLNGRKVCIEGSHDRGIRAKPFECITIRGVPVMLIHDPNAVSPNWQGWIIHGHVHDTRPFVDETLKRTNVSVEVTDYKPVSLDTIAQILGANRGGR
jgi:calcineurin-like phosphoesterase family protein